MRVDLFGSCTLVQADKPVQEVITRGVVVIAPGKIGEVVFQRRAG